MKIMFVVLSSILIGLLSATFSNAQSEQEMYRDYFESLKERSYDSRIAPEGTPVQVLVTMYILDVHKIDDFNMDYRASFYFRQSWNDSRLAYSAGNKEDPYIILNDERHIWTPDLFFVQEIDGVKHKITTPNVFVRISPTGEVLYSVRVTLTLSCGMDFRRYPHDSQFCKFNIESYGKRVEQLKLDWDFRTREPIMKTEKINVLPFELELIGYSARDSKFDSGSYRDLEVTLAFHRKIGFYITRLYVPFIILVTLSWLSFWIKPKLALLRVPLLLVIMYMMINIGSDIGSFIPPAPYTKASDVWIAMSESLVFAAFLEFILVSIISRSEKKCQRKGSSCSSDPEAPIISDLKNKDKSVNSEIMNPAFKNAVCRLSKSSQLSKKIDLVSRITFPLIFILFNLVYWCVY